MFKLSKKQRNYFKEKNKEYYWNNKEYRDSKKQKMQEYYQANPEYFKEHAKKQWKKSKKDPVLMLKNKYNSRVWREENKTYRREYEKAFSQAKFLTKINEYRKSFQLEPYASFEDYLAQKLQYQKEFKETNAIRVKEGKSPFQCLAQFKAFIAKRDGIYYPKLRY